MNSLLYYLLQVAIASAIFYGYYHVALRNRKFHQYNRFYLLAAALLSILVPFLDIPIYFTRDERGSSIVWQTLTLFSEPSPQAVPVSYSIEKTVDPGFHYLNLFYCAYALIASLAFARLLLSLLRVKKIIDDYPSEKLGDINFLITTERGTPFSFFRWLFWRKDIDLNSAKGGQIFRHELFHIRQRHSVDILFMEFLTIIFWINPFFHLMKREIRAIHEFLADRFAIDETQKNEYAELLLMQALQTSQPLSNHFFNNQIKRRIAMITNPKNTNYQYARKLLVLPLAALITGLFAFNYKASTQTTKPASPGTTLQADAPSTSRKQYLLSKPEKIVMEADTIIFHQGSSTEPLDYHKAVFFVNGKKRDYNFISNVSLLADTIVFYGNSNKDALVIYGPVAVNGVVDVKNAGIVQSPPSQYFRNVLAGNAELTSTVKVNNASGITSVYDISIAESKPQETALDNKKNMIIQFTPDFFIRFESLSIAGPMLTYKVPPELIIVNGQQFSMEEARKRFNRALIRSAETTFIPARNANAIKRYGNAARNGAVEFRNAQIIFNMPLPNSPKAIQGASLISEQYPGDTVPRIYTKVEIEPAFPGGENAWKKYMRANIDESIPALKHAPKGDYTIYVRFIVNRNGSVTDITPLTNHGFGMEEEAIRIIAKVSTWLPALQDGKKVNAYKTIAINFRVDKTAELNPVRSFNGDLQAIAAERMQEIAEIKTIAKNAAAVAYIYKGRTYLFADQEATRFTEQDGTNHVFLVNGDLVSSANEVNQRVRRDRITGITLLSSRDAGARYNMKGDIVTITTN